MASAHPYPRSWRAAAWRTHPDDTAQNCPDGTLLALVTCAHAEDPHGEHPGDATATDVAQSLGYEPLYGFRGDVAVARFAVDQARHVPLLPGDLRFIKDISGVPDPALLRAVISAIIHDSIAGTESRGVSAVPAPWPS